MSRAGACSVAIVEIQGVGRVQFPDSMSEEEITRVIETEILKPSPSGMDRVNAAASGFNSGVAGILGLPVDTAANVVDLGKAGIGSAYTAITGKAAPEALQIQSRENLPLSGDWFRGLMGSAARNPRPDDTASRYLHAAGAGASSALTAPAVGASVAPAVTGGITGGLSTQLAAELGAPPAVQALAGMAGGVAPELVRAGAGEAIRRAVRGGESGRQRMAETVDTFEQAGTTASVGQAAQNRRSRSLESLLGRTPGAAGRMARVAATQADDLGSTAERVAARLAPKASGEQAGRAVTRGMSDFVDDFKASSEALYNQLDTHIPLNARVDVSATRRALDALNADIPGAKNLSQFFKNAKIKGIQRALDEDLMAAPLEDDLVSQVVLDMVRRADPVKARQMLEGFRDGKLPYEAVKKLRTLVGREISDSTLVSDVPKSKWKALYAALSEDISAAAKQAGPEAVRSLNRANTFYKAGMKRIETVQSVIDKAGGPEAVFRAATAGTKEGATTLRAVMQSLPDDGRRMVAATVIRRLGLAKPGMQNELGERFSTETFLTNWNNLSPEAKRALFDRFDPAMRDNLDAIAKSAANIREGSAVFRNPSGTAQATTQAATAATFALSVLSGQWGVAGMTVGLAGLANVSARAMTSPQFVRWLAQSTRLPADFAPAAINRLAQQAAVSDDPVMKETAALLTQSMNQRRQDGPYQ